MASKKTLSGFSETLIADRLRFDNPWWKTGQLDDDFGSKRPRAYFDLFHPLVSSSVRRAVVLMGPRRVGKTVMMHHSIGKLLESDGDPRKIAYINVENPIFNNIGLERLFQLAREAVGKVDLKGWHVFFDEIQYLKNWEVHLKVLVDSYPGVKFIASGSAAAALRMKSQESGAGRFTDFLLPPLTFYEYVALKDVERIVQPNEIEWRGSRHSFFTTTDIDELNKQFVGYVNFGGYPEVIFSDDIRANPERFIKSDIVDKVLLRDLPSLYGIRDVQELNSFFTTLAYHTAQEVSLEALSKASGVEKQTIKRYLEYLEAAFMIRIVNRVDENGKRFRRATLFKVYLTNPSIRSALFAPLEPNDELFGSLVETAVVCQWMHRESFIPYYSRWRSGEVDLVGLSSKKQNPVWALEIKWSNRFYKDPSQLSKLVSFCRKNNIDSAMITTLNTTGNSIQQDVALHFVPSSLYAYTVGANTLLKRIENSVDANEIIF